MILCIRIDFIQFFQLSVIRGSQLNPEEENEKKNVRKCDMSIE